MYLYFIIWIIPHRLICRHCWHIDSHTYHHQNRYAFQMDFRAAELWSHAPSIVEKLDVAIKQLGNLRGNRKGCGELVLGIRILQVDVFGLMLLWLKISNDFKIFLFPWRRPELKRMSFTFPGSFAQFEPMTSGLPQAEVKRSGQRRPVDRFGYRYRSPGHRGGAPEAWQVGMEYSDLF